jgi:hypothetical protein
MKKTILLILLAIVFSLALVKADMPTTHQYLFDELMKNNYNNDFFKACKANPKECYSGNVLIDFSVAYYYTTFQRYLVTHDPNFCVALMRSANTDLEKACAAGGCIHLTQDLPSHTKMVPYCIEHSFLPNKVIHPFCEQHLDNYVISQNPDVKEEVLTSLNSYSTCTGLFKRVIQGNYNTEYQGIDLDEVFGTFVGQVQGSKTGFDITFKNISGLPISVLITYIFAMVIMFILLMLLIFKRLRFKDRRTFLNWATFIVLLFANILLISVFVAAIGGQGFNTFVFFIKPISNLVPTGGDSIYLQQSLQNSKDFFIQGDQFLINLHQQGYDPSGDAQLTAADNSIAFWSYSIMFILIIITAILLFFNFRTKKTY